MNELHDGKCNLLCTIISIIIQGLDV